MVVEDRQKKEEIASVDIKHSPLDSFGTALFLIVLVEIILLFGLNLYQNSRIKTLTQKINDAKTTLASAEYATINKQIDEVLDGQELLQQTLSSKVAWSKFYTKLSAITPKNVKINTIQVSNSGTFRADGETTSLSSLAQLLLAWQKGKADAVTPFSQVQLASNGYSDDEGKRVVNFSITGTINTGVVSQ